MLVAEPWIELEIILLSKTSQRQKDKYHILSPMYNLGVVFNTQTESQGREERLGEQWRK